jgi:RimJ/RimL family protein N-acetyltransferase
VSRRFRRLRRLPRFRTRAHPRRSLPARGGVRATCSPCRPLALNGFGRWIVADRATDAALGVVGPFFPADWPEPEIAWSVFAEAEGRGIAFEAASAARAFAYDRLGWTTAISLIAPENIRSAALARRLGCREDGTHDHPVHGAIPIWRHPGPAEAAA